METIKRLYLYFGSLVGLGFLMAGCIALLQLAVQWLPLRPSGGAYDPQLRDTLAQAIGVVTVGLPLWLVHWGLLERSIARHDADGAADRDSAIRTLYLSILLAWLLVWGALAGVDFVRQLGFRLFGLDFAWETNSLAQLFATAAVVWIAWAYHARVRLRDLRHAGPLAWPTGWVDRAYVYGAALLGVVGALVSFATAENALVDWGSGAPDLSRAQPGFDNAAGVDWQRALVAAVAGLIVFAAIAAIHLLYAQRRRARPDDLGRAERGSQLRLTFLVGLFALGAAVAVASLGGAIGVPLARAGAVLTGFTSSQTATDALRSFLVAVPFAAVAGVAGRLATHEFGPGSTWNGLRAIAYSAAAVGLAIFSVGLAGLIERLVWGQSSWTPCCDVVVTGQPLGDETWLSLAQTLAGLTLAVWAWRNIRGRLLRDRAAETRALLRRVYLFGVVGAGVVWGGWAATLLLSYAIRQVLGSTYEPLAVSVGGPLGALAAATVLLATHLPALIHELPAAQRAPITAAEGPAAEPPAAPAVSAGAKIVSAAPLPTEAVEPRRVLIITGPRGADMEGLRAALANRVPIGYSVRVADEPDAR